MQSTLREVNIMRNIFIQAHQLTKQIITQGDDYRATFALALKTIYEGISMTTISNRQEFSSATADERREWMNSLRKEISGTKEEVKAVNAVIDAFIESTANMTRIKIRRSRRIVEFINEAMNYENHEWLILGDQDAAAIFYPEKLEEYKAEEAEKEAEAEARNKAREEADIKERAERDDGFPELKGTIKQVAWANDIRKAMCTKKLGHAFDDVQREALKSVNKAKTARFWIDNYKHIYKNYIHK